jgi:putative RNA 2'-phosphotransferase
MAARYLPKTLAKALTYVAFHSCSEFGLFWDAGGAMPWKELYWALQEDPDLRFVREAHVREITLLGLELPFSLDGGVLRLKNGVALPFAPHLPEGLPERLYHGIGLKRYFHVRSHGLIRSARPHIPFFADKELALRVAKRRDLEPLLLGVKAKEAQSAGVQFLASGPGLFLAEEIAAEFLIFPAVREEALARFTTQPEKKPKGPEKTVPASPGSFLVQPHHLGQAQHPEITPTASKSGRKGDAWKKERRRDRHKRSI